MELLAPACYAVFSGTLNEGTFSKKTHKFQGGCLGTEFMIYDVDLSGRNAAVLLNFSQERDCHTDASITGLNSASIRFSGFASAGVDIHNHWGRLSLEKLKNDKGITLVDSKPRIVTTVSDIRYQDRLDSFFKKTAPNEVVDPLFAEKDRFDPATMASFGWEYAPRDYESTKEAGSSWRYFAADKFKPAETGRILLELTANDMIKSYTRSGCRKIFNFEDEEKFPDELFCQSALSTHHIIRLIEGFKRNYGSNLLSINKEPQSAVVVKLAGCHDFLLTTLEKKDELCFEHFSDHELLSYFQDSWHEHLEKINSKEFERDTLPLLGRILSAIDESHKKIVDFIEMLSTMTNAMFKEIAAIGISQQAITDRMIEFQSLYRELVLIQKQIEFYKVVEKSTQQNIDEINDDSWRDRLTHSMYEGINIIGGSKAYQDELVEYFREWSLKSNLKEKKKAISRLKVLNQKLFITQYKINIQPTLEHMLLSLAGKLIDLKHSSSDECLHNDYHRWFIITNEVLVMIGLNKPDFDRSGNRRSLEPLDLAADLNFPWSAQKSSTPSC